MFEKLEINAALVAKLKLGNESAWETVVKLHGRDLYACAAHFMGAGADAENTVQETWLQAHLKIADFEFRGPGSLYGWLRKICVYKAFETVRASHKQLIQSSEELEVLSMNAAKLAHQQIEAEAAKAAMVDLVKQTLTGLGGLCARILDLRELQEQSYAAIAAVMKMPIGTVMSRLARCRQQLKERLQPKLKEQS